MHMNGGIARGMVIMLAMALTFGIVAGRDVSAAETLYNGIELPAPWPPGYGNDEKAMPDPLPTPYYVKNPPPVIPIDVGRQLFVDDFLIESTTLKRGLHQADFYPGNPLQRASPYSGGMWWDTRDNTLKMWLGRSIQTSQDGIHWATPPELQGKGAIPGMHSSAIWIDPDAKDPGKRYVAIYSRTYEPPGKCRYWVRFSPDGINWSEKFDTRADCGDRSTAFYNPFRKIWVYSIRQGWYKPRSRRYWEMKDLEQDPYWNLDDQQGPIVRAPYWVGADSLDYPREDVLDKEWVDEKKGTEPRAGAPCQLYNLDCLAYESLMLGFFSIWRGQPERGSKTNDLCMGFSRDGWSWSRPDRLPVIAMPDTQGKNMGTHLNMQSVVGGCLIMGDKLYIYAAHSGLWLGTMRRDGFVSMDAGEAEGVLTTRPLTFNGKYLFVNVDAPKGELRVEVLDEKDNAIAGCDKADCAPISADITLQRVTWKGAADLSALAGKPVKFRFHLRNGKLYSFWVSPDESGASHGYTGGGGPGFTGQTDTVGQAAYEAAKALPQAPGK
jgi:hypothetical protein